MKKGIFSVSVRVPSFKVACFNQEEQIEKELKLKPPKN